MPYMRRASSGRSLARRSVRSPGTTRAGRRLVWTNFNLQGTLVGGVPQRLDLLTNFRAAYGVTALPGYTLQRIRGSIAAVPTVAPAAGTQGLLIMGYLEDSGQITAAQADPSAAATMQGFHWGWLDRWHQPYLAAPVGASQVLEARRNVDIRVKRLITDLGDNAFIYMGEANAAQSWRFQIDLMILLAQP